MPMTKTFAALVLGLSLIAAPLAAKPPLRDVAEIDNALLAVGLADEIRKTCDDIDARMFRALSFLSELKDRAGALGYTDEEIEAYVTSKAEKRRMRARGEAWLAERGASPDDEAALCRLGRAEMAKDSAIGRLLR